MMADLNAFRYCGSRKTIYKRYDWRPAHGFGMNYQVIHRRVRCNCCGAGFATIHPEALAKINNRISASFPFMFLTVSGPGLTTMPLLAHIALISKGIQVGTFCGVLNQLLKIQYATSHEAYLDAVIDWLQQPPVVVESKVPIPYGAFSNSSGHLGVELLKRTLIAALKSFMANYEEYM